MMILKLMNVWREATRENIAKLPKKSSEICRFLSSPQTIPDDSDRI